MKMGQIAKNRRNGGEGRKLDVLKIERGKMNRGVITIDSIP